MFRIAFTLHVDVGRGGGDFAKIIRRELDVKRAKVFLQAGELGRAGDGDDPGLLRQQPGECDLRRGRVLLPADAP